MGESDFREKYKNSKWALKQLTEAKDFWKRFPKINFYDKSIVDSLKEEFKENEYILSRINKELKSKLDSEFKHYLEESEVNKYKNKAKTLVDYALSENKYARV